MNLITREQANNSTKIAKKKKAEDMVFFELLKDEQVAVFDEVKKAINGAIESGKYEVFHCVKSKGTFKSLTKESELMKPIFDILHNLEFTTKIETEVCTANELYFFIQWD